MSSSMHVDDKKKNVLILGEGPTQELNDTALTVEKTYSISFTKSRKKCLGCIINGAIDYLFVNGTEIHKFKAKISEIVATPFCLGNISKDFLKDNMIKTGLTG